MLSGLKEDAVFAEHLGRTEALFVDLQGRFFWDDVEPHGSPRSRLGPGAGAAAEEAEAANNRDTGGRELAGGGGQRLTPSCSSEPLW